MPPFFPPGSKGSIAKEKRPVQRPLSISALLCERVLNPASSIYTFHGRHKHYQVSVVPLIE